MNEEDDRPRRPARFTPLPLDALGVDELEAYIGSLRDEIARTEAEITRKRAVRDAASSFFKK